MSSNDIKAQLEARNAEIVKLVAEGEWKKLSEIYAPNGTSILSGGILRGRAAIEEHYAKNPLKGLEVKTIEANNVDGKTATEVGKYSMLTNDGTKHEGHYLSVWVLVDQQWYTLYDAVVG